MLDNVDDDDEDDEIDDISLDDDDDDDSNDDDDSDKSSNSDYRASRRSNRRKYIIINAFFVFIDRKSKQKDNNVDVDNSNEELQAIESVVIESFRRRAPQPTQRTTAIVLVDVVRIFRFSFLFFKKKTN